MAKAYRTKRMHAMSYSATHYALSNITSITAGQKLTLAVITSHTDKSGRCWPSVPTIARKASLSVRTVQRALHDLEQANLITRAFRAGRSAITQLGAAFYAAASGDTVAQAVVTPWHHSSEPVNFESRNTSAKLTPVAVLPVAPVGALGLKECPNTEQPTAEQPKSPQARALALGGASVSPDPEKTPVGDSDAVDAQALLAALAVIPHELWADLGLVRKAKKKAPKPTQTELMHWYVQGRIAGLALVEVVRCIVLRQWSRFEATWLTERHPAHLVKTTTPYRHEPLPPPPVPASPEVLAAGRARIAESLARWRAGPPDPLGWAKQALAKHEAGEPVRSALVASARAALGLR